MPPTGAHRVSLWARVVAACAVVALVTAALLVFEAALFGVVAYGALVLFDGAVRVVAPPVGILSPVGVAPVGALLATVALFGIVGGVYRVETDPGEDIDTGYQILAGAYVALIGASIVLTDWAIRWLGFPRWVLAVVLVTLIALFYPMVLYKVSKEKTESATDDQRSWQTDSGGNAEDATTDANELPSDAGDEETTADQTTAEASGWLGRTRRRLRENRRENIAEWRARWAERWALVVAVAAELRRAVTLPYRSRGLPGVAAVAYGDQDFTADVGATVTDDKTESLYARQKTVVAAAAAGVDALDTVETDIADTDGLREQTEFVAELGFDGKLAIHTDQVPVINEAFTPAAEEIEWAETVLAGQERASEAGTGVFTVDGQMIDPPLVARAEKIVERAEAAGVR